MILFSLPFVACSVFPSLFRLSNCSLDVSPQFSLSLSCSFSFPLLHIPNEFTLSIYSFIPFPRTVVLHVSHTPFSDLILLLLHLLRRMTFLLSLFPFPFFLPTLFCSSLLLPFALSFQLSRKGKAFFQKYYLVTREEYSSSFQESIDPITSILMSMRK